MQITVNDFVPFVILLLDNLEEPNKTENKKHEQTILTGLHSSSYDF